MCKTREQDLRNHAVRVTGGPFAFTASCPTDDDRNALFTAMVCKLRHTYTITQSYEFNLGTAAHPEWKTLTRSERGEVDREEVLALEAYEARRKADLACFIRADA